MTPLKTTADPGICEEVDLILLSTESTDASVHGPRAGGQRRLHPRFECSARASLKAGRWPAARVFAGQVLDFSAVGARVGLAGGGSLPLGATVRLRWNVPGVDGYEGPVGEQLLRGVVVHETRREANASTYGIRFKGSIPEQAAESGAWVAKLAAVAGAALLAAGIVHLRVHHVGWFWYAPFLTGYSLLAACFMLSRFVLSSFYSEPEDKGFLPTVSVVITAKNEEACIVETVECCFGSNYPAEKLEVIVVDDGSTDATWELAKVLEARHPDLKLVRFAKNLGKRHAMAAGARMAVGDILVYVDSDTFVEPDAVYRLVQAFHDSAVGAVAGHILVDVEPDSFISKMESVRYYISHRILKAAESLFGAVTCCPGAFSAYRRSAVMEVLDPWLNQKFLGVQATFGDDRSLTNFILRNYHVLFHNGARCSTRVPDTWGRYFKQQLRWKKSWSRETLVASRILCREHPVAALSYYAGVVLTILSPIVLIHSMLYLPISMGMHPFHYLGGLLLSHLLLGVVCFYYTRSRYWYYGLSFACLYIGVLSWQNYYAMFTINRTSWGTR